MEFLKKTIKNIKRKDIVRTLLLVLLAAVVGVNVHAMISARVAGDMVSMPFGFGASVVLSGSMEPELSVGDMIIIVPHDTYAVGDVVVFQSGRTAVVHRIVDMEGEEITTRGDANNAPDAPVSLSAVKGKVIFSIPFVGYLINLIKTPIGTISLLGLAIWLLESSFEKDKKKDTDEIEALRREIEQLKNENK